MNHPNPNLDFEALLNRDPIAIFSVLKLSKQVYAEIDVGFVSQFFGQLPKKWYIFNAAGNFHMLGFNEKKENPLLEQGWKKFHHHHSFPKNVEIIFGYYEEGLFAINSLKELDFNRDDLFLPFHSRSLMPKLTKALGKTLSAYLAKRPTQLDNILLIGDNDQTEEFQLSITSFNPLIMELHPNWDKFCISNNFVVGNPLRFKLALLSTSEQSTFFSNIGSNTITNPNQRSKPEIGHQPSSMAFSTTRFNTSGVQKKFPTTFQTIINPKMSKIPIPKNFCKNWKTEIAKNRFGWICGDKYSVMVSIHLSDTCNYLASGSQVADSFGFAKPTKVLLEYTIDENQFEMTLLPTISNQKPVPDIVNIDDSEDESNYHKYPALFGKQVKHKYSKTSKWNQPKKNSANGASTSAKKVKPKSSQKATKCKVKINGEGLYEWQTSVSAAMARRTKAQVLILTAKRSKMEKYISKEWCSFVKQRNLRIGDKLIFKLSKPSTTLNLRILRV
ncbi:hypothetical protein P8452_67525 [Trifolium repens]|nr:hypothetical protein P8452_67525 [Trifolium repens]